MRRKKLTDNQLVSMKLQGYKNKDFTLKEMLESRAEMDLTYARLKGKIYK